MDDTTQDWNPGHDVIRAEAAAEREKEVVLEPFLWGLFSLGGFITAFLMPVTIFLLAFMVPLGLWSPDRIGYDFLSSAFGNLLVRLFFLVLVGGALFHGMHRLRFLLVDVGVRAERLLDVLCYGTAILGSLAALYYTLLFDFRMPF